MHTRENTFRSGLAVQKEETRVDQRHRFEPDDNDIDEVGIIVGLLPDSIVFAGGSSLSENLKPFMQMKPLVETAAVLLRIARNRSNGVQV